MLARLRLLRRRAVRAKSESHEQLTEASKAATVCSAASLHQALCQCDEPWMDEVTVHRLRCKLLDLLICTFPCLLLIFTLRTIDQEALCVKCPRELQSCQGSAVRLLQELRLCHTHVAQGLAVLLLEKRVLSLHLQSVKVYLHQ